MVVLGDEGGDTAGCVYRRVYVYVYVARKGESLGCDVSAAFD